MQRTTRNTTAPDATTPTASDTSRDPPVCIGERQVAVMLGCSASLVQKMRLRDEGPPYLKIGHGRGRVVYPVAALREWIAVRMQEASAGPEARPEHEGYLAGGAPMT